MAIPMYGQYDPYDDRELRMRARSREEYEYLKEQKYREMQMMQNMMPPVMMPAPQPKPAHLNNKLLLTKGA